LKLLVVQQQVYIQRLQLKNNEMEGTIRDILGENPDVSFSIVTERYPRTILGDVLFTKTKVNKFNK